MVQQILHRSDEKLLHISSKQFINSKNDKDDSMLADCMVNLEYSRILLSWTPWGPGEVSFILILGVNLY